MNIIDEIKIDKTQIEVFQNFESARNADRKFWMSKSIEERFHAIEIMRQINYDYDPITDRLQRVLEVVTQQQR